MKTPDTHETLLPLSAQIKNGIEKGIATPNEKIIESIKSICKLQSSGNYSRICFGGEQTMKTPEEIKKGLECCPGQYSSIGCGKCPYSIDGRYCGRNGDQPMKDALTYIQQLEASYSQVSKALCDKENATLDEVLQAVRQVKNQLQAYEESAIKCCYESRCNKEINALYECCNRLEKELEAVKRERDAAAKDLIKVAKSQIICDVCSNDHRKDPICMSHQGDCSECSLHCPCDGCFDEWELRITGANFAWRGVCLENTEVQDDG